METWMTEYTRQLLIAYENNPKAYAYDQDDIPNVLNNMRNAFRNGSFNKDSESIKATCKAFKIKHTYKDIQRFIDNHA
jgi:hypothetical protein